MPNDLKHVFFKRTYSHNIVGPIAGHSYTCKPYIFTISYGRNILVLESKANMNLTRKAPRVPHVSRSFSVLSLASSRKSSIKFADWKGLYQFIIRYLYSMQKYTHKIVPSLDDTHGNAKSSYNMYISQDRWWCWLIRWLWLSMLCIDCNLWNISTLRHTFCAGDYRRRSELSNSMNGDDLTLASCLQKFWTAKFTCAETTAGCHWTQRWHASVFLIDVPEAVNKKGIYTKLTRICIRMVVMQIVKGFSEVDILLDICTLDNFFLP